MKTDGDLYYSEREQGVVPATESALSDGFCVGFRTLIGRLMRDGSFAEVFPEHCFENPVPVDCDGKAMSEALRAEVPEFSWPVEGQLPKTLPMLDAVEFYARHVSRVAERVWHSYGRHDHFVRFDRMAGFRDYADTVNRLFRRNRHPYELGDNQRVRRTVPEVLDVVLETELRTGDGELDKLISSAIERFRNPDLDVRKEALEKLWDAWERLKTLLNPDKKTGVKELLETIPGAELRERIDSEASALTRIGNDFLIRHSETDRIPIETDAEVDYLFHRLYALIRFLVMGLARNEVSTQ